MSQPTTQQPPPPEDLGAAEIAGALAAAFAAQQAAEATAGLVTGLPVAERLVRAGKVLALLLRWMRWWSGRAGDWLRGALQARVGQRAEEWDAVIEGIIALEQRLERRFQADSLRRVAVATANAMQIEDRGRRDQAIKRAVEAEKRYAIQRSQAMLGRAIAAIDRATLKIESPLGAFWVLDDALDNTAGCQFMSGRFWPWEVLDRVHPARHHGCGCGLLGYGQAVARGLMGPDDVLDPATAVRMASPIEMEF